MMEDRGRVRGTLRIERFDASGQFEGVDEFHNLFLTSGINELWNLFSGQGANVFNNANATIGIGDSSTAPAAGQTDLQAGANKTYKGMDGGYPQPPSAGSIVYRATFGSTDANYAWNEFVLKHSGSGICLDRGTGSFGTKAAGTTWVATLTLTIS